MLDPADGETIEDFHDAAARAFSRLATEFRPVTGLPGNGLAEKVPISETGVEPGPPTHGGDAGEAVRQPEA